jgi:5-methylcytosine-specific restriction protein B
MVKYLSTDSIIQSLQYLNKDEMSNASIFFIYLIMKRLGITKTSFVNQDILKEGLPFIFNLGSTYSPEENAPKKNNFIYPFANQYLKGSPGESIEKWASGRLKNNVLGGATTWRPLVNEDTATKKLKFSFQYVEEIKKLCIKEKKVNIVALAIWSARFDEFNKEMHEDLFVKAFKQLYKISDDEYENLFFVDKEGLSLHFQEEKPDYAEIRKFIDNDSVMGDEWYEVENLDKEKQIMSSDTAGIKMSQHKVKNLTEEKLLELFDISHQIILSGPPATSKSFIAKSIGSNFKKVFHMQFHPQTSYNEFIGGYKVNGSDVEYKEGVLLKIINEINDDGNPSHRFLLIIDEINRTNLSQVFGEVIQCLDRDYSVRLTTKNNESVEFSLPKNLFIIGTQNSSDRTLGSMDFALKRRFLKVNLYPDSDLLLSLCSSQNNMNSILSNLLHKINENLLQTTKNIDFQIGHALFLDTEEVDGEGKFIWTYSKLEKIFNYKILPIVIDFCYNDFSLVHEVLGELSQLLEGEEFQLAIEAYVK